jgi:hypothetical protein
MSVNVNLANVWSFINTAVAPAAVLVSGWAISEASKFLKIKAGSQAQDDLDQAISHGEALLVDWYKSAENHNKSVVVPDDKLGEIANRVLDLAPAAENILGVTPEDLAPLLQAKLTGWLHWHTMLPASGIAPAFAPAPEPAATVQAAPTPSAPAAAS